LTHETRRRKMENTNCPVCGCSDYQHRDSVESNHVRCVGCDTNYDLENQEELDESRRKLAMVTKIVKMQRFLIVALKEGVQTRKFDFEDALDVVEYSLRVDRKTAEYIYGRN